MSLAWIAAGFLCGSLPFSVWIGRLALGVDVRDYGDGNPGAFNVFRAGGRGWGWLAILLDGLKGAVPVALAKSFAGEGGWLPALTALAAVAGHAFSPFLRFRGGKALAVTFGAWTGLSLWLAPVTLGALFAVFRPALRNDRLAVLLGQAGLLAVLLALHADWTWFAFWAGSVVVILAKTRRVNESASQRVSDSTIQRFSDSAKAH
jgi:glycerol-3-phosphate acyltransferase PlsY